MNVVNAVRFYIEKMTADSGNGMKILLLDQETKSIVSVAYSQSEIASKEVFLFDLLENYNRDEMKHLKCICFLRPTKQNLQNLMRELKNPKYSHYYLYFTNIIEKMDIKTLAESDEQETVSGVEEIFADFIAVNYHVFSFNQPNCGDGYKWNENAFKRTSQGLLALLLSLKKIPCIRYQNNSEMARRLADSIKNAITRETTLFNFRKPEIAPVLLIVDRREDSVTPLLNQWTYQAMVHELIGIKNNLVSLKNVPGISKELEEIIISAEYDEFYENSMFLNYGEICVKMKELMEDFQRKSQSTAKVETIADMKAFVENYPQFKKMSGTVSKHVTLVSELSRLVSTQNLMECSEIEQQLACQGDNGDILQKIKNLMKDTRVKSSDLLRLVCLYSLRYENNSNNESSNLRETLLKRGGLSNQEREFMTKICSYGGSRFRETDLFDNQNPIAITKRILKGFKGVENVYTQHSPLAKSLVEQLIKGKLKETSYPFAGTNISRDRPQEIIIFVIGGITYEETFAIHSINRAFAGNIKVVIGGTCVHNFKSFIEEVLAMGGSNTFATINETTSPTSSYRANTTPSRNTFGTK